MNAKLSAFVTGNDWLSDSQLLGHRLLADAAFLAYFSDALRDGSRTTDRVSGLHLRAFIRVSKRV